MRVPTVCLFVVCALSASLREQSVLRPSGSLSRVDSSQYGALLLDVIDLQLEADGSVSDVIDVLDELLRDIMGKQTQADIQYEIDSKECTDKEEAYSNIIEGARTSIVDANSELDRLKPRKKSLKSEIGSEQEKMLKNRNDRSVAIAARRVANDLYLLRKKEHEDSIDACNEAIEILQDLKQENQIELQTASSFNLIQVQKASVVLMDLKEKIERMSTDNSPFTPYLKVLLEVAASQDNFSDQSTVAEINGLLVQLRDDIQESLRFLKDAEDSEVVSHELFLTDNQTNFDNIELKLSELSEEYGQVNKDIQTQEGIVEDKDKVKIEFEELLLQHQKKCDAIHDKYKVDTEERNGEIDIINQAKALFTAPEEYDSKK